MPNKIEIQNGNKKGQIKRVIYAYCDFEDYEVLIKHRWILSVSNGKEYPTTHFTNENRITDSLMVAGTKIMGNFLMNPQKGYCVKYLDGNPFNCRRENLFITVNPKSKKII